MNYLRAIKCHLSIVWRDFHGGRVSWSTAWRTSKLIWLTEEEQNNV